MADTHEQLIGRLASVLTTLRDIGPLPDRLCEAGRQMMSADGAAIILTSDGTRMTLSSTDEMSGALEDMQDVVGQGPSFSCLETGEVEIAAFNGPEDSRWPLMHEHGQRLGFNGTVFAVPLQVDDHAVIGLLSAHRAAPAVDKDSIVGRFLGAALSAALLQDPQLGLGQLSPAEGWPSQSQVHQATGMVVAQVGVRPDDALALIKGQAFMQNTTLADVAQQIIDRRINFRQFTIEGD